MAFLSEAELEELLLQNFERLGYERSTDAEIGPDGTSSERENYGDVILQRRLVAAIEKLNADIPSEARQDAFKSLLATVTPSLVEENRRLHRFMVEGVGVEYYDTDGTIRGDTVRLIDFDTLEVNDWLVLSQMTVIENGNRRRPDVVLYLNGLPLAVIELKNPGDENATLDGAFNQLQTYKEQIPSLFRTNAVLVTSDGLHARLGSLTANIERFMPWRTVDGSAVAPKGAPELDTVIEGVFEKARFLTLIRDFTVFADTGSGLVKIVAGYHQFHAVRHAVTSTIAAASPKGDRRIGVIWHTQGSGKSLLMAFYAGQIIAHSAMENPTVVVITDRNDLDDQLYGTFATCHDLLRQTPRQADSREDLQKALTRPSGGVVFTTIQKFAPESGETDYPVLTDRRNVVVIADEAHRSQYGFRARVNRKTGEIAHGFAKYLRDALPNASFIGFTGTPIEKEDVNTPAVFGEYIDVYDINRGVEDGATVPIYYESRLARIELDEDEKPKLDDEVAELTEDEAQGEQEKLKRKWAKIEAVVGAEKRLAMVAKDLVEHFDNRIVGMDGKAMIVCMSRRICVALYDQIIKLRPKWHSDDDQSGVIKIVMTAAASDPKEWQQHIGGKARRGLLAKRAKDPEDPLKLVIVRDMWLTGFDVPSMHTMYIDKPMRGHGLMQAIARVNRVFRDKPAGLVVDYIGLAQNLKAALGTVFGQRSAARRHRRVRGRCRDAGEVRDRERHDPRFRLPSGAHWRSAGTARGACRGDGVGPRNAAARGRQGIDRGRQETRASPLQRRCYGTLQGVRPRSRQRRSAGNPRRGGILSDRPGGARQEGAWRGQDLCRAGPGRAADNQPCRRLDRYHRYSRSRRVGHAGHLHPLRRVSRRGSGNGEEKPRHGGAAQADQRRDTLAEPHQRCADPGFL